MMPAGKITPADLKDRLDAGEDLLVLDVREPWELEIASLDFARHMLMNTIPHSLDEIPKDKTVVLVCRSGNRSMQVGNYLVQRGWDQTKVLNLEGGILGWGREIDPDIQAY